MPALPGRTNSVKGAGWASPNPCPKTEKRRPVEVTLAAAVFVDGKRADLFCFRRPKNTKEKSRPITCHVGFENVAFPNALGDRGTSRETDRVSHKLIPSVRDRIMASRSGGKVRHAYVPRPSPLALLINVKKTPRVPARASRSVTSPACPFPNLTRSRPRRSGSGGFVPASAELSFRPASFPPPRRCYDKKVRHGASISTVSDPALPAERFSRTSLSLLCSLPRSRSSHREARRHHQLCSSTNSAYKGFRWVARGPRAFAPAPQPGA